ncbi:putative motility protein YjfB-like [Sinobaca qinghaiensis]|uniref:Putative motility protein YjfB-like n=2 Tax=Sinobaca qinghaiensis TaxID=342944 RepID=A0A419V942_9BACL|nr:YjfB family protein [Sinobaca qinghaiensis]RKD76530.1 putative motility protein YjfB-like [Sinobaca qinghaiensis]
MDIAALSMAMSQGEVKQQASVSMMKKVMGQAGEQSEALKKLIESADVQKIKQAAQPHLGGSIDFKK